MSNWFKAKVLAYILKVGSPQSTLVSLRCSAHVITVSAIMDSEAKLNEQSKGLVEISPVSDEWSYKTLKKLYHRCSHLTKQIAHVAPTLKNIVSQSKELSAKLNDTCESCERFSETLDHIEQCFAEAREARNLVTTEISKIKAQLSWFQRQLQLMSSKLAVSVSDLMVKDQKECRAYANHLKSIYKSEYKQYFSHKKVMHRKAAGVKRIVGSANKRAHLKRYAMKCLCKTSTFTKEQLLDSTLYFREAVGHLKQCQSDQAMLIVSRLQVITETLSLLLSDGAMHFSLNGERVASPAGVSMALNGVESTNGPYGSVSGVAHLPLYSLTYGESTRKKHTGIKSEEQSGICEGACARIKLLSIVEASRKRKKIARDEGGSCETETYASKGETENKMLHNESAPKTTNDLTTKCPSMSSTKTLSFDDACASLTTGLHHINESVETEGKHPENEDEATDNEGSQQKTLQSEWKIGLCEIDSAQIRSLTGQLNSVVLSPADNREELTATSTMRFFPTSDSENQEMRTTDSSELAAQYTNQMPNSRVAALVQLFENLR
ncbi:hypothetical protein M514_11244 [Trichuris suis]|uniref:Uncharacterized protein n=1 Tax=Trichuris suis TaxID=68888 RepID=A0A085N577_9BILA|nr:hypothetical protein M514_11244 [Trichuris suis]